VLEGQWLVAALSGGRAALFYVLILVHAVSALVGFGSIGFAGTYASRAYLPGNDASPGSPEQGPVPSDQLQPVDTEVAEQDAETEELLRYFEKPARLWPLLVAVPFLGLGALASNPSLGGLDQAWVLGALLVWLSAILIAVSLVVPALRQMRAMLFRRDRPEDGPGREAERVRFARTATLAGRGAACCDVLFFAALALMIWRP
jgi:hypothetical protein